MRSIIIQVKGDRIPATLRLIATQGFNVTSEAELALIATIYELQGQTTFMLNEGVRKQIIAKLTPSNPANYTQLRGITDGALKVNISRLVKAGVLTRSGKLLGLHSIFKDVDVCEQVVIRIL